VHQGVEQPLAFNFFNPAIDLQRPESPVLPFRTLGIEPEPATLTPATQPLRRLGSLFRRGFSLSSPTLHPLASSPLPQTHFSATEVGGPSPFARGVGEYARPTEMGYLYFSDDYYTGTSRHLAPEDIAQELRRRRDSHEDLDAQRGTGSMVPPFHSYPDFISSSSRGDARGFTVKGECAGLYRTPTGLWCIR
jgi:hypothetical protein